MVTFWQARHQNKNGGPYKTVISNSAQNITFTQKLMIHSLFLGEI